MIKKGYTPSKWKLLNHTWPTKWENIMPSMIEDSWLIDMYRNG
jgi:hypothetical protein